MKKIIFAVAILVTLGAACKKEKAPATGTIQLVNNSENPYHVYINGELEVSAMPGKSSKDLPGKPTGYYVVRVLQAAGYLLTPTEVEYQGELTEGMRQVVSFP